MSDPKNQLLGTPPAIKEVSRSLVLLEIYLSLPPKEREKKFAGSGKAAEFAGVSQRTIGKWINEGKIESLLIADKHHVWLDSLRTHLQNQVENDLAG